MMAEFDRLKNSYVTAIQTAIISGTSYNGVKNGNDALHNFCKILVETSCAPEESKNSMKNELDVLKEALAAEIESSYQKP